MSTVNQGVELLVAINPFRAVAFVLNDGIVIGVTSGTTNDYVGKSAEDVKLAMSSVLRFRYDGKMEGSCDGYPDIFRLKMNGEGVTEVYNLLDEMRCSHL